MDASAPASPSPRREQLVDVALLVLEAGGVEKLSIGEIARRASIKPPSLYKHFSSKADIELAMIERGFAQFTAAVTGALAGAPNTRRGKLEAFAKVYRANALAHPQLYRLMNDRPLDRKRITRATEYAAMADLVALIPDEHIGRSVWSWAHGLVMLEIADRYPAGADLDAAWRVLVDFASES